MPIPLKKEKENKFTATHQSISYPVDPFAYLLMHVCKLMHCVKSQGFFLSAAFMHQEFERYDSMWIFRFVIARYPSSAIEGVGEVTAAVRAADLQSLINHLDLGADDLLQNKFADPHQAM
uniref:Uncharacterized protein n=1 Tax=Arundo donax TaxID=35708 RepID=A0A0A9E668_ARUDO